MSLIKIYSLHHSTKTLFRKHSPIKLVVNCISFRDVKNKNLVIIDSIMLAHV